MAQFYLLSVVANIIAGLTLAGDFLGEKFAFLASFRNLRGNRTAQIVIGIATAAVGFITFFVRAPEDTVPVVGDLLPSLGAIIVGITLLVESFRTQVENRGPQAEKVSRALLTYRVPMGIAGACIGLLHFLFPAAVIL